MKAVHVSEKAEADLEESWIHIAQDNPPAADRLLAAVELAFDTIGRAAWRRLAEAVQESAATRVAPLASAGLPQLPHFLPRD